MIHQLRHIERIVKVTGLHQRASHSYRVRDPGCIGLPSVAELLFEAAGQFPDLEFIDFGSGFKVAYKEGDVVTDLEELGRDMSARFREFCRAYGRPLQLWFEPGKYL